jgi:hypothetical protein
MGDLYMSLIHTCELNGVNPFDYLTELQRHTEQVRQAPAEWMPWNDGERLSSTDRRDRFRVGMNRLRGRNESTPAMVKWRSEMPRKRLRKRQSLTILARHANRLKCCGLGSTRAFPPTISRRWRCRTGLRGCMPPGVAG